MEYMKKIIVCILAFFCLIGCSSNTSEEAVETKEDCSILVVYFSVTGNTETLAEYASEYYNAPIFEIKPTIAYTDEDINYNDSKSRTSIEQNDSSIRPEIMNSLDNMDQYDTILLGYPIWWGQAPRIIETFLESYDFSNKTILPFCTSASSDIGSSDDNLYDLVSSSVNWLDGKRFSVNTDKDTFIEWVDSLLH